MFGWAALDVLLGLFFRLLLSIIGTAIQEFVVSLLKLRASNLREVSKTCSMTRSFSITPSSRI